MATISLLTPPKKEDSKAGLSWLVKRARPAGRWMGLSVGLGTLSGILLIAQAGCLSRIVHGAAVMGWGKEVLWPFFPALLGIVLARAVLAWAREAAGFRAGATVRMNVRSAIMAHITRLGPAYTTHQKTGALSSTVMEQVEALHGFFAHYLPQLALAVAIPASILMFVFPISWAAGGLLLVTAPLIPLFMILIGMGVQSISQRYFQSLSRMSAHFLDVLQGLSTLKLFYRSIAEEARVAKVSRAYRKQTMKVLKVAFLSSAVLEFFTSIAIALVAVYLGMSYLGYYAFGAWGEPITLQGGLFILLLAPEFYLPLRELGTHYHTRAEAMGAAEEIRSVLDLPLPKAPDRPIAVNTDKGLFLEFENVHLTYPDRSRPALEGIDFRLDTGRTTTIVGESGAGKTTLIHLILGHFTPGRGQIRFNGIPSERVSAEQRRRLFSWIGQDPVLFHGTIRDNIRLGAPRASQAEIERAAAATRVSHFTADLPDGLDTRVGERGYGLSRGQAQRIALARAYLKNAPVLLLDEPTSGLDRENEAHILSSLARLAAGKTVLMLTHRMGGIEKASRILVMSEGKVVEQGSHDELMAARGALFRLVHRQGRDDEG